MYAFLESKAKADIKVIEFTKLMEARQQTTFTDDISSYIDNADNYIIIGASFFIQDGAGSSKTNAEKWFSFYSEAGKNSSNVVTDVAIFPKPVLYNANSKRYIQYVLVNATGIHRTNVKFRVVLLRIGDMITA